MSSKSVATLPYDARCRSSQSNFACAAFRCPYAAARFAAVQETLLCARVLGVAQSLRAVSHFL